MKASLSGMRWINVLRTVSVLGIMLLGLVTGCLGVEGYAHNECHHKLLGKTVRFKSTQPDLQIHNNWPNPAKISFKDEITGARIVLDTGDLNWECKKLKDSPHDQAKTTAGD